MCRKMMQHRLGAEKIVPAPESSPLSLWNAAGDQLLAVCVCAI